MVERGLELIQRLNGVGRLLNLIAEPVSFGDEVMRTNGDGKRAVYFLPPAAAARGDGTIPRVSGIAPPERSTAETFMLEAEGDPAVARAIRLFAQSHTWDTLYKILDAVKEAVGDENKLKTRRWVARPVMAWVATLRTTLQLPLAQVQWLLDRVWGLRLSLGELNALLVETARAGHPVYEALLGEARASPVVHVDETSWREDGRTGWVWTLTTPRCALPVLKQAGAVARRLLGENGDAAVVSDFFGTYNDLERPPARRAAPRPARGCRAADAPSSVAGVAPWAAGVRDVYDRAVARRAPLPGTVYAGGQAQPPDRVPREDDPFRLGERLAQVRVVQASVHGPRQVDHALLQRRVGGIGGGASLVAVSQGGGTLLPIRHQHPMHLPHQPPQRGRGLRGGQVAHQHPVQHHQSLLFRAAQADCLPQRGDRISDQFPVTLSQINDTTT